MKNGGFIKVEMILFVFKAKLFNTQDIDLEKSPPDRNSQAITFAWSDLTVVTEPVSGRVLHSHCSGSIQTLCSDWLDIKTQQKAGTTFSGYSRCLVLCLYGL